MKHKLVNWSEGLGIAPGHFRQAEDYFTELISANLAIGISNHRFGLLLPASDSESSSAIDILEKVTGKVEIKLRRCNAITRGGYRISFNPAPEDYIVSYYSFDKSMSKDNDTWNIILSVNPYKRIPVGIPDEEEDPPRHPDVVPSIELYIVPAREMNAGKMNPQQLIIGKIRKNGEQFLIDNDYIPPCVCMGSSPLLLKYYNHFAILLDDLEKASGDIIAKVRNKDNPSQLAINIELLSRDLMRYIPTVYFSFRNKGLYWSPLDTVDCFSSLAHVYFMSISFISIKEKEELLNYFSEWEEINPGMFEACVAEVLELQYNHNDILLMMQPINTFLSTLTQLWTKLSQLEYIGQHRENLIVSDKKLKDENHKSSRWNILK